MYEVNPKMSRELTERTGVVFIGTKQVYIVVVTLLPLTTLKKDTRE